MSDVFDVDLSLVCERLSSEKMLNRRQRRNAAHDSMEVRKFTQSSVVSKFCALCRAVNVDPLHPMSLHTIFVMFSKVLQKTETLSKLKERASQILEKKVTVPKNLDWEALDDSDTKDILSAMSDWLVLLEYLQCIPIVNTQPLNDDDSMTIDGCEDDDELLQIPAISKFVGSMRHAQMTSQYTMTLPLALQGFLHMNIAGLVTCKMLERFLLNTQHASSASSHPPFHDMEVRCLRINAFYTDLQLSEEDLSTTMAIVLAHMEIKPTFLHDIKLVLAREAESFESKKKDTTVQKRFQMRRFSASVQQQQGVEYMLTFDNWVAQQKFPSTMSRQLQHLLYFIASQEQKVPEHLYMKYFTDGMTNRMKTVCIEQIQPDVIKRMIHSLRVYHYNVPDLLDFRMDCLQGLSSTLRQKLTMPQVLQLYVSCFQHPSIRDDCWKSVLPVLNHTIAAACEKFRASHDFNVGPVIESMVRCQLGDVVVNAT
tara:strand:- start:195 stop:1640 length:1446 start_codon:yes stop_codon:yes gene_type:complete